MDLIKPLCRLFSAPAIVKPDAIMPVRSAALVTSRRAFLGGALAAPAIIRVADLMPISVVPSPTVLMAADTSPIAGLTRVWVGTAGNGEAAAWTEIGLVESLAIEQADPFVTSANVIGDGRMRLAKGTRDNGTLDLGCFSAKDPGQAELAAAARSAGRPRVPGRWAKRVPSFRRLGNEPSEGCSGSRATRSSASDSSSRLTRQYSRAERHHTAPTPAPAKADPARRRPAATAAARP
jgi:hypothetical protein